MRPALSRFVAAKPCRRRRSSQRGLTVAEVLIATFAAILTVALTLGLVRALTEARAGRYAQVVYGLADVASAVRRYGQDNRWFSGARPQSRAGQYRRLGQQNFCGVRNLRGQEGAPRSVFLISRDSLERGGYLAENIDAGWENGVRIRNIEYRPDPERHPDSENELRDWFAELRGDDNADLWDLGEGTLKKFYDRCSLDPTKDLILIRLANPGADSTLKDTIEEYFDEARECQRVKVVANADELHLSWAPNSDQDVRC